jgi:hypothetical protein
VSKQDLAERAAQIMQREDRASRWLGIELDAEAVEVARLGAAPFTTCA